MSILAQEKKKYHHEQHVSHGAQIAKHILCIKGYQNKQITCGEELLFLLLCSCTKMLLQELRTFMLCKQPKVLF